MYNDIPLVNNEAKHNFEIVVEGHRAFIDYQKRGEVFLLVHTEVPQEIEGKGVAGALVEKTFKYLEENHFKMMPFCAYIQSYLKRYPDWDRLIAKK